MSLRKLPTIAILALAYATWGSAATNITVSVVLDHGGRPGCKITPRLYGDFISSGRFDSLAEANPDAELALGRLGTLPECGRFQISSLHRAISQARAAHLASLSFSLARPSATRHSCGTARPFAEGINIYFISLDESDRSEEAALSLLSRFMDDPITFC